MNKLPWFTHDNDAHEDLFIRSLLSKYGLAGYGLFWLLIEILDRHGKGDQVSITWTELERQGCTKRSFCKPVVAYLIEQCKIIDHSTDQSLLVYEIPNHRKRQSNMKSKIISNSHQKPSNTTGEVEENRIDKNRIELSPKSPLNFNQPKTDKPDRFKTYLDLPYDPRVQAILGHPQNGNGTKPEPVNTEPVPALNLTAAVKDIPDPDSQEDKQRIANRKAYLLEQAKKLGVKL